MASAWTAVMERVQVTGGGEKPGLGAAHLLKRAGGDGEGGFVENRDGSGKGQSETEIIRPFAE